jgi:NhaB family Na+:H+ antiporter
MRSLLRRNAGLPAAFAANFLGHSENWYKLTIAAFLIANPIVLLTAGPFVAGWLLMIEFIFTLIMSLRCYPLQPGGLLAFEAVLLGLATPDGVFHEVEAAFEVILLLIFMVAGIFFLKDLLLFIFTKLLLGVRSKVRLAFVFCALAALLSAFLDALTVTAVVITVGGGFYAIYHRAASGKRPNQSHDISADAQVQELHREDLEHFRAFLRSLVMHAAVGTALGGVMTLVGEPQNLLIGGVAGWGFVEFFVRMLPVSLPVLVAGLGTCVLLERFRLFGYGATLPEAVRAVLADAERADAQNRSPRQSSLLVVQVLVVVFLVFGLVLQWAVVGIVGLGVIILATAFGGIADERSVGRAFTEALPFTALLVVFFAVVAVIHEQALFAPVLDWALALPPQLQPSMFYLANGLLSAISDNVFVATIYISEVKAALDAVVIDRAQFDVLAVAINTGTNIPSVATPSGQAAFLFLLTSALAPLIRLSYVRMLVMALPYTITMTSAGLFAVLYAY